MESLISLGCASARERGATRQISLQSGAAALASIPKRVWRNRSKLRKSMGKLAWRCERELPLSVRYPRPPACDWGKNSGFIHISDKLSTEKWHLSTFQAASLQAVSAFPVFQKQLPLLNKPIQLAGQALSGVAGKAQIFQNATPGFQVDWLLREESHRLAPGF